MYILLCHRVESPYTAGVGSVGSTRTPKTKWSNIKDMQSKGQLLVVSEIPITSV